MMKIGISAGDPAGIGLEVTLKALDELRDQACWVLFAGREDYQAARARLGVELGARTWSPQTSVKRGVFLSLLDGMGPAIEPGAGGPESGRRALAVLEAAGRAALAGEIDGLVTAPLAKQWVGGGFEGHTGYLARQAGVSRYAMTFFTPTFTVVLVTTHVSLRRALDSLSVERYTDLLALVSRELRRFGMPNPRIAVAAINPHAGEGGMFGTEDDEILVPAVHAARDAGLNVSGPYPADSLYSRAHQGEFDVVIAPFHDQGLVPVKLIAPRSAANVTLGLPYVRTSPDHGTAFDIAGRGQADAGGMKTAMAWAIRLLESGPADSVS
jgi:4-hydroxythreonine-4-phosphate dehydrogenase